MIKLTIDISKMPLSRLYSETSFYFRNMKECNMFIYVFKDHNVDVPWNNPVESDTFQDMTDDQIRSVDEDPIYRAESNLSWGFSLCRELNIERTAEQEAFINYMTEYMLKERNGQNEKSN